MGSLLSPVPFAPTRRVGAHRHTDRRAMRRHRRRHASIVEFNVVRRAESDASIPLRNDARSGVIRRRRRFRTTFPRRRERVSRSRLIMPRIGTENRNQTYTKQLSLSSIFFTRSQTNQHTPSNTLPWRMPKQLWIGCRLFPTSLITRTSSRVCTPSHWRAPPYLGYRQGRESITTQSVGYAGWMIFCVLFDALSVS